MCNRLEQCAFFQIGNAERVISFPLIPRAEAAPFIRVIHHHQCIYSISLSLSVPPFPKDNCSHSIHPLQLRPTAGSRGTNTPRETNLWTPLAVLGQVHVWFRWTRVPVQNASASVAQTGSPKSEI